MNPDELRDRLARIDPALHASTDDPATPSSRSRLERIMQTEPTPTTTTADRPGRTWRWAAAVAAALLVVAGGVALAVDGDDAPEAAGPPLELDLGASDTMASCVALSPEILADMEQAFAATATAVEGETVTLEVTTWYAGGDADTVVLHAASGMEALIDGFAFEAGADYLVSAHDGTVSFCGFSGPATPALQSVYDQAFPG